MTGSNGPELIAAVFQGGGAKGVAYSGVLGALEEREISICRVGGASAGAITAALVAAKLPASKLREEVPRALSSLSETKMKPAGGMRRTLRLARHHHQTGEVYSTSSLESWLRGLLLQDSDLEEGPTFQELFQRTEVELQIVAANVSTASQIVFNHVQTPHVDVVRAVLASAAIPGAFRPGSLVLPAEGVENPSIAEGSERWTTVANHDYIRETLVDGGVWANYPDFVFRDKSFRKWAKLPAVDEPIIGFTLSPAKHKDDGERLLEARLLDAQTAVRVNRRESLVDDNPVRLSRTQSWFPFFLAATIAAVALGWAIGNSWPTRMAATVLAIVPALLATEGMAASRERTGRFDHPPWPIDSRARLWGDRLLVVLGNGRFFPGLVILLPLLGGMVGCAALFAYTLTADRLVGYLFWGTLTAFLTVSIVLAAAFASAVLLGIRYSSPLILSSMIGTSRTLLAASTSPPAWTGFDPSYEAVVRLPVPEGVDTLTFDIDNEKVDEADQAARMATLIFLDQRWPKSS